jgi:hypothetical protein
MGIRTFFINRLVKSARGFSPGKRLACGATLYEASMSLLSQILIVHGRRHGSMDSLRLSIAERVAAHFTEHVMFRVCPAEISTGVLSDMDRDYDRVGRHAFERFYEHAMVELGRTFPQVLDKELLCHLAMFQRVDVVAMNNSERLAAIRDAHALLFGRVTHDDVEEVVNHAGSYAVGTTHYV